MFAREGADYAQVGHRLDKTGVSCERGHLLYVVYPVIGQVLYPLIARAVPYHHF